MPLFCHLSSHDEGDFRTVGFRVEIITAHGDDVFAVGCRQRGDDGHFVAVVDVDEVFDLLVRNPRHVAHEAVVDRLLRQVVEQIPHQRLVGGVDRTEVDLCAVIEQIAWCAVPAGRRRSCRFLVGQSRPRGTWSRWPRAAVGRGISGWAMLISAMARSCTLLPCR